MPGTRTFFLGCVLIALIGGAILSFGAFSSREMPEEAFQGMHVWQANGCESCHTLYGYGGDYAPDLTHIYNQRGETYLREFIVNPNAFHPDQRIMPRFTLSVDETSGLIAFLRWINEQPEAENWPPRVIQVAGIGGFGLAASSGSRSEEISAADPALTRGQTIFSQRCASCHSLTPDVVQVGPSLAGIADTAWYRIPGKGPEQYIRESIIDPGSFIVDGFVDAMQKNFGDQLSSQELDDVIRFLMTLEQES